MPLPFALVCELLDESHGLCLSRKSNRPAVEAWFTRHRTRIDAHDTNLVALLSTLLPEKRSDRVYFIQAPTLEKIIGRGLSLGASRKLELARYREPGSGVDLADCVERILTVTPTHLLAENRVTVEQIDELLHGLAARIKWSSPAIRASQTPLTQRDRSDLERIYSRITATEAKWLTRLVLKNYAPLILDENLVLRLCDPLLPSVLKIREDFTAAVGVAQSMRSTLLPNTGRRQSAQTKLLAKVKPQAGTKVGRQHWVQARSIKHCLDQGRGRMSVETKIDGEYCQVHIDLSKGSLCIQIFSKSGKDSTEDRQGLHGIIRDSLRIHKPGCMFSKACIVEGELVVYSDFANKILPFHKIRNHVTRRDRFLNTEQDSLPKAHEHLMLVYYDVLLLDEQSLLDVRHSERFKILTSLVECQKGWAELVPREVIDFGHSLAASNLRKLFARTIVNRQEGLVLKPDEPYFDFSVPGRPWSSRCIKLKKEYIGNFGDVGDFAAIGAGYDPVKAKHYNISNLRWTHFYIGCLNNREELRRWSAKPEFTVVNVVELNETQLKSVARFGNPRPVPRDRNEDIHLKIAPGIELNPRLSVVFTNPMVFDLRCFSFEKGGTTGFWSLRFPMVSKVHFDRDFTDTFSFEQLQNMATEATKIPDLPDSQENLHWIAMLEGADPRGIAVDAVSQLTATTIPTPSPCRSTPSASQGPVQSPRACRKSVILTSPQTYAGPSRDIRCEFGLPALPLITPPTSSEPTAQSPEQGLHNRGLKRDSRLSSKASQSRKTRKSAGKCQTSSSPLQQMNRSQLRKPLGQIDANSSQRSRHSLSPDSEPAKVTEPAAEPAAEHDVIDLTSPTGEPSFATVPKMDSSPAADASSQESEEVIVFLPDDDRHHEAHCTPLPSDENASPPPTEERVSEFSSGHKRTGCIHAGPQCQFAKTTVLLAPHLAEPPPRMSTLLDTHDIKSVTSNIKAWMVDLGRKVEPNAMLLVDSVEHPGATKALLEMMADQRKTLPRERCGEEAITVFDWRVLDYITILEDKSITRKYYDGFRDPWRRWYCGLV